MIQEFYDRLHRSISTSKSIAYSYYTERYTYQDLYRYMKRLNYYLADHKRKKIVLYGSKSFCVYSAIYGIVLSGNVWAPFTPGHPVKRLLEMLEILDADIIIYEENLPTELKTFAGKKHIPLWNLKILLSQDGEKEFEDFNLAEDDPAYIMFTSGSTGTPKGVPMTHKNYINFVNNAMSIMPFKKGDVFSDYHDFAFDISIFYLFCAPLTEGAIAPIRKDEERIFPVKHFQENKITIWSSVPSVISRIQRLRPDEEIENKIRILFMCGEPFGLNILSYCLGKLKVKNVYNFYGLTETGVENFYHECSPADLRLYEDKGFVPIGKPLKDNEIKVTDEKELLISGCQITPGYLGGIEPDRFEIRDGKRWYHTGDIVEEFRGVYFCKGRLDSQVKLSGYRVELMDIEVHIKKYPGVKEAVCVVDDTKGMKTLACVYEQAKGAAVDEKGIRAQLQKNLPEYMIPKRFFVLNEMPRNNNGKLDRKRIKEIYLNDLSKPDKLKVL